MYDHTKIARALSDPIRYKIMKMLAGSEQVCCSMPGEDGEPPGLCNCVLMKELGMIQSRVSYHMRELVEVGLVTEKPSGRWKYYFLNPKVLGSFIDRLREDFLLKD